MRSEDIGVEDVPKQTPNAQKQTYKRADFKKERSLKEVKASAAAEADDAFSGPQSKFVPSLIKPNRSGEKSQTTQTSKETETEANPKRTATNTQMCRLQLGEIPCGRVKIRKSAKVTQSTRGDTHRTSIQLQRPLLRCPSPPAENSLAKPKEG